MTTMTAKGGSDFIREGFGDVMGTDDDIPIPFKADGSPVVIDWSRGGGGESGGRGGLPSGGIETVVEC